MKSNSVLKLKHLLWTLAGLVALGLLVAVTHSGAKPPAAAPPPLPVEVATVEQRDVPVYGEWIGTLEGLVNADVKAQVTGYLMKQDYREGSFVRKGQLLFEIDPRPFQAALDSAQAQLAQAKAQLANAEANQVRTQLDVERYTPLAKAEAASQQDLDNAVQNNLAAKATVETAKAQIQSAQAAVETGTINLNFTRLISPIDGIAGVAQLQVGALVSTASGAVTTVSTLDPIKAYFTMSEQEYLQAASHYNYSAGPSNTEGRTRRPTQLELILADGMVYPRTGTFYFADRAVDPNTGAIRIAGLFPNPGNVLRPGQYGRIRSVTTTETGALLVPQRAVSELQGSYQVAVVDPGNKIRFQPVKVGERLDTLWVIKDGLKPGERVVAEGVQKVMPGMVVNPTPFAAKSAVSN
ncbi:MAG TPA: efflux RND transporter periplasmic adaptor subunit [Terriglobia bacterium]|nr:efflux RND transporter periplasmic adaptor subunit [Terriglobia bacterium]